MIHEFDPAIYPTRLWVTKDATREEMRETFYFLDDKDEVVDDPQLAEGSRLPYASTYAVAHKENHWMGCLVVIWLPRRCGVDNVAHEASHCTDYLCDHLGVNGFNWDGGEARAYYLGWAAKCINNVLKDIKNKD